MEDTALILFYGRHKKFHRISDHHIMQEPFLYYNKDINISFSFAGGKSYGIQSEIL